MKTIDINELIGLNIRYIRWDKNNYTYSNRFIFVFDNGKEVMMKMYVNENLYVCTKNNQLFDYNNILDVKIKDIYWYRFNNISALIIIDDKENFYKFFSDLRILGKSITKLYDCTRNRIKKRAYEKV